VKSIANENAPKDFKVDAKRVFDLYTGRTAVIGWILVVVFTAASYFFREKIESVVIFYAFFIVAIASLSLIFLPIIKRVMNKTADEQDIIFFKLYRVFIAALLLVLVLSLVMPVFNGTKTVV
jgi:hypothetical protein